MSTPSPLDPPTDQPEALYRQGETQAILSTLIEIKGLLEQLLELNKRIAQTSLGISP